MGATGPAPPVSLHAGRASRACTITKIYDFSGTLDENTCQMSGNGTLDFSWAGPYDPCFWTEMQCEQGVSGFTWQANIDRGTVNGNLPFNLNFHQYQIAGE